MSIGKRILNKELTTEGVPVFSANVFEPFGYTDKTLLLDFSKDSVIWGIDGDWMVNTLPVNYKFYPTDHCGVIRLKQANIIEPKFLAYLLYNEGKKSKFSRTYRASIDRISQLSICIPDYRKQQEVIKEINRIEKIMHELENRISTINDKKKEIISSLLK